MVYARPKARFKASSYRRVWDGLMQIGRPATSREIAKQIGTTADHVRDVTRHMFVQGYLKRYRPRYGFGCPEIYYYPSSYKRDFDSTCAIWRHGEAHARKTATALLFAFESLGETSVVELAKSVGVGAEAARNFLERMRERGRAVRRKARSGERRAKGGYWIYYPVRR